MGTSKHARPSPSAELTLWKGDHSLLLSFCYPKFCSSTVQALELAFVCVTMSTLHGRLGLHPQLLPANGHSGGRLWVFVTLVSEMLRTLWWELGE